MHTFYHVTHKMRDVEMKKICCIIKYKPYTYANLYANLYIHE